MGWFSSFLYSQFLVTPPFPTKDFSGQTIIVTGSNTGLGLEAARHFNRLNAKLVILAVRNVPKGSAARDSILESTGRPSNSIQVWELDLQSYDSVKAFAAKAQGLERLDAVLENAGIMTKHFKMVAGHESVITTNVISTFLLALMLLPKLRETANKYNVQPRLSLVVSDLHYVAKFPERNKENIFDALDNEKNTEMGMERYAVSKLLEILALRELAALTTPRADDQQSHPEIIMNCMTPGACRSEFDRESSGISRFIFNIVSHILARSAEVGSRTLVAGVVAGEESHGSYMADGVVAPVAPLVLSAEGEILQQRVWKELGGILEGIQPGILRNVYP